MTLAEEYNSWGLAESHNTRQKIITLITIGLILGILAPFGTTEPASFVIRTLYWVGVLVLAGIISEPIERLAIPWSLKQEYPVYIAYLCHSVILSLPLFVVVIGAEVLFDGLFINKQGLSIERAAEVIQSGGSIFAFDILYGQVLFMTLLVNGLIILVQGNLSKKVAIHTPAPVGNIFFNRLPPELGTDLICLSMEDHYVRAHTTEGNTLIFMRLSDAVTELASYPGIQIHRSWWVSLKAIKAVKKEKRRHMVQLTNGMTAPASQTYMDRLKEAGFIW